VPTKVYWGAQSHDDQGNTGSIYLFFSSFEAFNLEDWSFA
jgi:hypothetical protein